MKIAISFPAAVPAALFLIPGTALLRFREKGSGGTEECTETEGRMRGWRI